MTHNDVPFNVSQALEQVKKGIIVAIPRLSDDIIERYTRKQRVAFPSSLVRPIKIRRIDRNSEGFIYGLVSEDSDDDEIQSISNNPLIVSISSGESEDEEVVVEKCITHVSLDSPDDDVKGELNGVESDEVMVIEGIDVATSPQHQPHVNEPVPTDPCDEQSQPDDINSTDVSPVLPIPRVSPAVSPCAKSAVANSQQITGHECSSFLWEDENLSSDIELDVTPSPVNSPPPSPAGETALSKLDGDMEIDDISSPREHGAQDSPSPPSDDRSKEVMNKEVINADKLLSNLFINALNKNNNSSESFTSKITHELNEGPRSPAKSISEFAENPSSCRDSVSIEENTISREVDFPKQSESDPTIDSVETPTPSTNLQTESDEHSETVEESALNIIPNSNRCEEGVSVEQVPDNTLSIPRENVFSKDSDSSPVPDYGESGASSTPQRTQSGEDGEVVEHVPICESFTPEIVQESNDSEENLTHDEVVPSSTLTPSRQNQEPTDTVVPVSTPSDVPRDETPRKSCRSMSSLARELLFGPNPPKCPPTLHLDLPIISSIAASSVIKDLLLASPTRSKDIPTDRQLDDTTKRSEVTTKRSMVGVPHSLKSSKSVSVIIRNTSHSSAKVATQSSQSADTKAWSTSDLSASNHRPDGRKVEVSLNHLQSERLDVAKTTPSGHPHVTLAGFRLPEGIEVEVVNAKPDTINQPSSCVSEKTNPDVLHMPSLSPNSGFASCLNLTDNPVENVNPGPSTSGILTKATRNQRTESSQSSNKNYLSSVRPVIRVKPLETLIDDRNPVPSLLKDDPVRQNQPLDGQVINPTESKSSTEEEIGVNAPANFDAGAFISKMTDQKRFEEMANILLELRSFLDGAKGLDTLMKEIEPKLRGVVVNEKDAEKYENLKLLRAMKTTPLVEQLARLIRQSLSKMTLQQFVNALYRHFHSLLQKNNKTKNPNVLVLEKLLEMILYSGTCPVGDLPEIIDKNVLKTCFKMLLRNRRASAASSVNTAVTSPFNNIGCNSDDSDSRPNSADLDVVLVETPAPATRQQIPYQFMERATTSVPNTRTPAQRLFAEIDAPRRGIERSASSLRRDLVKKCMERSASTFQMDKRYTERNIDPSYQAGSSSQLGMFARNLVPQQNTSRGWSNCPNNSQHQFSPPPYPQQNMMPECNATRHSTEGQQQYPVVPPNNPRNQQSYTHAYSSYDPLQQMHDGVRIISTSAERYAKLNTQSVPMCSSQAQMASTYTQSAPVSPYYYQSNQTCPIVPHPYQDNVATPTLSQHYQSNPPTRDYPTTNISHAVLHVNNISSGLVTGPMVNTNIAFNTQQNAYQTLSYDTTVGNRIARTAQSVGVNMYNYPNNYGSNTWIPPIEDPIPPSNQFALPSNAGMQMPVSNRSSTNGDEPASVSSSMSPVNRYPPFNVMDSQTNQPTSTTNERPTSRPVVQVPIVQSSSGTSSPNFDQICGVSNTQTVDKELPSSILKDTDIAEYFNTAFPDVSFDPKDFFYQLRGKYNGVSGQIIANGNPVFIASPYYFTMVEPNQRNLATQSVSPVRPWV